jgi:3',5'-cyclic AMP phosphodiesterase CpdA
MPISLYPAISRRRFIQTAIAAGTGHILAPRGLAASESAGGSPGGRWALVSDIHVPEDRRNVYRGFQPYDNFKAVVAQLQKAQPKGVVITGDIARLEGMPGDYANVQTLIDPLRSTTSVYMCLGNHDDRENFLAALKDLPGERQPVEDKYVNVVHTNGVRLVLLDSLLYVDRVAGLLGKNQRTWLAEYLEKADDRPTLLFVHHTLGDEDDELLDADRMFAIVKPHKNVKAIVFGHSHAYEYDTENGIHLINLPATGYNFSDDEPLGWVEADITTQGADLTLHVIGGNFEKDGETTSLTWST